MPFLLTIKNGLCFLIFVALISGGCKSKGNPGQPVDPAMLLKSELRNWVDSLQTTESGPDYSIKILSASILIEYYRDNRFEPAWIRKDTITPRMDSMIRLIQDARAVGLFPEHYHLRELSLASDSIRVDTLRTGIRNDPRALAHIDGLLTDAFLTMARHIHRGHLSLDSLAREEGFNPTIYMEALSRATTTQNPRSILESFEPQKIGYQALKKALPNFLRRARFDKQYTYVAYPFQDSLEFIRSLVKRFQEDRYIEDSITSIDSASLARTIKKVQVARGLTVDGKYGRQLVSSLNNNDAEKFLAAAINMDRYRMETDTLPHRYLLVNLPAFELHVMDHDTIRLESRVIIGKPKTPTPLLVSRMNQIIVYPTWTIPASIIADEILPALKRDPGYLARKGYNLYDYQGNEVDPYYVNWSKYKKGIPYKIVQGEGIGNALGIMKFNFPNEHSVYLHDTNQRGLFQNENRSLSHGCVRVQNWTGLYRYIIQQDSIKALENNSAFTRSDSIAAWLKQKRKRVITIKDPLPIYFRYYTAAGKEGKLEIYQDVYGLDEPFRSRIRKAR